MRGIVERNAMRQLLAVEAYLDTRAAAAERDRARFERFHDLTERHAEQLRELERDEYLALKAPSSSARSSGSGRPTARRADAHSAVGRLRRTLAA